MLKKILAKNSKSKKNKNMNEFFKSFDESKESNHFFTTYTIQNSNLKRYN